MIKNRWNIISSCYGSSDCLSFCFGIFHSTFYTLAYHVTFQFCKKLYGYGYYDREYIQSILDKFDEMGRPFAKYIFGLYLKTELKLEAEMYKEAGQDMPKEIDRNYERMVKESQWQKKEKVSRSQNYATISQMLGFK